jgi:hypothetical protein
MLAESWLRAQTGALVNAALTMTNLSLAANATRR